MAVPRTQHLLPPHVDNVLTPALRQPLILPHLPGHPLHHLRLQRLPLVPHLHLAAHISAQRSVVVPEVILIPRTHVTDHDDIDECKRIRGGVVAVESL